MAVVISCKVPNPQFEGQTKTKLGNTEAKAFVQKVVSEQLNDWFDRNPQQAKNIVRKAMDANTARLAARKARAARMPDPEAALKAMMEQAGLERVEVFNMTAGVVALHRAYKF